MSWIRYPNCTPMHKEEPNHGTKWHQKRHQIYLIQNEPTGIVVFWGSEGRRWGFINRVTGAQKMTLAPNWICRELVAVESSNPAVPGDS
jgi:hypothetical protein